MVAVVVVEFLCALAISGTALWHERWTRFRAFDEMLAGRSDSLLGAIQDAEDADDNVTIDPRELSLPREDLYAVYDPGGRLLGSSPQALPVLICDGAMDSAPSTVYPANMNIACCSGGGSALLTAKRRKVPG